MCLQTHGFHLRLKDGKCVWTYHIKEDEDEPNPPVPTAKKIFNLTDSQQSFPYKRSQSISFGLIQLLYKHGFPQVLFPREPLAVTGR